MADHILVIAEADADAAYGLDGSVRRQHTGIAGLGRAPYNYLKYKLLLFLTILAGLAWNGDTVHAADGRIPALQLALPIDCKLETECFIQNYVDMDAGSGARDFTCGHATYDGHKGVDFRLISTVKVKRPVSVLAASNGVVRGLRDGMADRLLTRRNASAVNRRECGNGVVLDHGKGWITQYCHLRRGSVRVVKGQHVTKGAILGHVGYSGKAAFAHLHLTVRHNNKVIDPFTGTRPKTRSAVRSGCNLTAGVEPAVGLWAPTSGLQEHVTGSRIIETGFVGRRLQSPSWELGIAKLPKFTRNSPVMLFVARTINLQTGDRVRLQLTGPGGINVKSISKPMPRPKATFTAYAGKRQRGKAWPAGSYQAQVEIWRDGRSISRVSQSLELASS